MGLPFSSNALIQQMCHTTIGTEPRILLRPAIQRGDSSRQGQCQSMQIFCLSLLHLFSVFALAQEYPLTTPLVHRDIVLRLINPE